MDRALAGAGARLWMAGARELIPTEPGRASTGRRALPSDRPGRAGATARVRSRAAGCVGSPSIPTTLARLLEADEINDLWIKSERAGTTVGGAQAGRHRSRAPVSAPRRTRRSTWPTLPCCAPTAKSPSSSRTSRRAQTHSTRRCRRTICCLPGTGCPLRMTRAEIVSDPAGCAAGLAALMASLGGPLVG